MNTYRGTGIRIAWTNGTGSDLASGGVAVIKSGLYGLIGIAVAAIANTATGEVQVEGVHELACLSTDTGSVGAAMYWDATAGNLTTTSTNNTLAGILETAKTNGQTTARIKLNSCPVTLTGGATLTGVETLTNKTLTSAILSGTLTSAMGASTAAAGSTTADAAVLPAGTASVYPTTAADDTKGVRIHANDKVTGREISIGNGVANKTLKVYAPSGGTINGAAADAAFSSASGKGVVIVCLDQAANTWLAW